MSFIRCVAAWGLLATLVAGGMVGPLVHRLQHGIEQSAAVAETACHPSSVHHTETPLWTNDGERLETRACELCATRFLVVPSDLDPTVSPRRTGATRVVLRTHLTPIHVVTDRTIRGPPYVSRARLA